MIRQNVIAGKCECFCIVAMMLEDNTTDEVPGNGERVCWSREYTRLKMAVMMVATAIG